MSYRIGIGVLIENESYNRIRNLEFRIANATDNFLGLSQPPHITVKSPFEAESLEVVGEIKKLMDRVGSQMPAFKVGLSGIGGFDNRVLFLKVEKSEKLEQLQTKLLNELERELPQTRNFEGKDIIFHSTLATGLTAGQYDRAENLLNQCQPRELSFKTDISKIGLFVEIENRSHWVIVKKSKLG